MKRLLDSVQEEFGSSILQLTTKELCELLMERYPTLNSESAEKLSHAIHDHYAKSENRGD
jgi:hypothetical protein